MYHNMWEIRVFRHLADRILNVRFKVNRPRALVYHNLLDRRQIANQSVSLTVNVHII